MLRALGPFIACAGMLAIVACGGRDPVADEANNTAGLPTINEPVSAASGEPPVNAAEPQDAAAPSAGAGKIPAALQGRWGLSPADCEPNRSDAKGLLVVTADRLSFYESRAVPSANLEADADSISGDFSFTGEGENWTKFQALQVKGRELVRTETNPAASFSYAKCT